MARDLLATIEGTPPKVVEARRLLAMLAPQFKEKLMRAGLVQTYHQMDRVTRMIGYEIAALESGHWPVTDLRFLDEP